MNECKSPVKPFKNGASKIVHQTACWIGDRITDWTGYAALQMSLQRAKGSHEMTLDIPFLNDIWFLWGNNGKRHTPENHKFIQGILERGEWDNMFFHPDAELVSIVASILSQPVQRTDDFCICARCG